MNPIFILIGLFILTSNAGALEPERFSFGGERTYPTSVVLSSQLPRQVQNDIYGTCHIQVASWAFNSACWRRTGVLFQSSVAYLFYRHYSDVLSGQGVLDSFLVDHNQGQFTENDAGDYALSIERIKSGSLLLESDFNMKIMTQAFQNAKVFRTNYLKLNPSDRIKVATQYEEKMKSILSFDMDQLFRTNIRGRISKAKSGFEFLMRENPTHPLNSCRTEELQILNLNLTPERAVRLINGGFPIICQFYSVAMKPQSGSHVTLIAGYTYHTNNLQFFHRDSTNAKLLSPMRGVDCYRASVVFNLSEQENLQKALN